MRFPQKRVNSFVDTSKLHEFRAQRRYCTRRAVPNCVAPRVISQGAGGRIGESDWKDPRKTGVTRLHRIIRKLFLWRLKHFPKKKSPITLTPIVIFFMSRLRASCRSSSKERNAIILGNVGVIDNLLYEEQEPSIHCRLSIIYTVRATRGYYTKYNNYEDNLL